MPQVPYSGVPTVAPGGVPQSRFHADVSEATFGGNVGAAISSLGGQLQRSGSELFERGAAMQTLYNHSEAQEADARYTEEAGKLHANYNTLQGKQAVDAYPQYIEDLKKTRQSIRDGLTNETSQKLFESSSNGTMGRSIFNGAGHAAGENKKYALGASQARVGAIGNQALSTPDDDRSFRDGVETTEREVRSQAQLLGLSPEATDEAVSMQKSKLWGQRIKGIAKQDPIRAGRMLEDGIKAGDVRGEDIGQLTNLVDQQRRTVGARMISNKVSQGGLSWGQGIVPIEQAQAAIAQNESGGRYDLEGPEVFRKDGTSRGRALGKYQVMPENLPGWLAQSGLPPMTPKEFLASPKAQDQVFNTIFGGYMKKYGSANEAASVWFTGKTIAEAGNISDTQPGFKGTTAPTYVANFNAALAKNAPLSQKVQMGQKLAGIEAPSDPLFPDFVEQRITTDHSRAVAIKRDDIWNARQPIETALMGGGKDGKLPTTIEELTSTPETQAAWQRLGEMDPAKQRQYRSVLVHNAKGEKYVWTDETMRQYQSYQGMARTNPAEFVEQDIIASKLPDSAKLSLIKLQQNLYGKSEGDPGINRALQILKPDLDSAGLDRHKDKETYNQFVGTLSDQIQTFMEDNKRPPKVDELKTMGARLLQSPTREELKEPGWWGKRNTPTFRVPVPTDEAEKIKQSGEWSKMGIVPTEEMIQRLYSRALYQKLYGGTVKAAP